MEHDDALSHLKRGWAEQRHFFSNAGKPERERWIVGEFLSRLSLSYEAHELISPSQHSKIDVVFRGACFQVKEIMNPGSKPGAEVEAIYKSVYDARRLEEIAGPVFVYDVPPVAKAYDLIRSEATRLSASGKYDEEIRARLDLLFYVTRTHASKIKQGEIQESTLSSLGWRSICCLIGNHAHVLSASPDAPRFLLRNCSGA